MGTSLITSLKRSINRLFIECKDVFFSDGSRVPAGADVIDTIIAELR